MSKTVTLVNGIQIYAEYDCKTPESSTLAVVAWVGAPAAGLRARLHSPEKMTDKLDKSPL